jgi:serine protease
MKFLVLILQLSFLTSAFNQGFTIQACNKPDASQGPEVKPGEMLVQFSGNIQNLCNNTDRAGCQLHLIQTVAEDWNIYLVGFDPKKTSPEAALQLVLTIPGVQHAQFNHRAPDRDLEPNDANWSLQDDMTLIKAPTAWDASTGGLTPAGDTIVIAVLEKGILFSHPDLAPNHWHNWGEIPNNQIDDDNNGYVDDYDGWNPRTLDDNNGISQTSTGNHGTGVSGIMGAAGNNTIGISGVNWNVKLMGLYNVEYENEIIAAYQYVNKMRKTYNSSNGQKGAFVVATNASFGIDFAKPEDHPLWCAVYDSLGQNGILSVAATSNQNVNVDVEGDMPTRCTSEFLVTVTNITKLAVKAPSTGYGATSIDLGAPGTDTYTTSNNGLNSPGYGKLGGTSSATPHVSGSVGLLYSFKCTVFTSDALTNPVSCLRRVRDAILQNTEPNTTLQSITTTGGHLNLSRSLDAVRDICDGIVGVLDILEVRTTTDGNILDVFYQTPNFETYNFRVFNMLGQLMYEKKLEPEEFQANHYTFDVSNLPAGIYVMAINKGRNVTSRKFRKI